MQYLGRIVTKSKLVEPLDFIEKIDDVTKIENTLPTLIVGKEMAENFYGKDKIKVLDRKITDNVSWTYTKMEKNGEYEKDSLIFNQNIIKNISKGIEYCYFDLFTAPFKRVKVLIGFIDSPKRKIVYLANKALYIYYQKRVFGISLSQIEYYNVKIDKIIDKIKKNPYNIYIDSDNFLSFRMKKMLGNSKKYIPYLYFLQNS